MKFNCCILCLPFLFISINTVAQDRYTYSSELHLESDNDAYLLRLRDGYYTNGIMIGWTYLPERKQKPDRKVEKLLSYYRIGQKIFNSDNWRSYLPEQIDRPFAGYLFAEKGFRLIYNSGDVLEFGLTAGTVGPAAYGAEIQGMLHRLLGFAKIRGWVYQIKNEAGASAFVKYDKHITGRSEKSLLQLRATGEGSLGNLFTYAKGGALLTFGEKEHADRSAQYRARIGDEKKLRRSEIYAFIHPQFLYQAYNATVQGGLFRNDKGAITAELNRFILMHEWGLVFAQDRWTSSVSFIKKQKEATSMRRDELFGAIKIAYRIGRKAHSRENGFTTDDNADSN